VRTDIPPEVVCALSEGQVSLAWTPAEGVVCLAAAKRGKGRLDLPIVSGKHLRKIADRTALQSADNAEKFITTRKIDSFESLAKFTEDREQKYQQLETVHLSKGQKLNRLKELI